MKKVWRESSTLIIAARKGLKGQSFSKNQKHVNTICNSLNILEKLRRPFDYHVLTLKRHENASILPGAFVFPGGVAEPEDSDLKWYSLFKSLGVKDDHFKLLNYNHPNKPHIFQSKENELPREMSLRITAVRETFEECGVLFCKTTPDSHLFNSNWAQHYDVPELESWQSKVHSNPKEFYNMCQELKCYPNLWALKEWSNWITPTIFPITRRFNAAFFVICMPEIPKAKHEDNEMDGFLWADPKTVLSLATYLPPPQKYEMTFFSQFEKLDDLHAFIFGDNNREIISRMPVTAILSNGTAQILPGDSMYPEKVHFFEEQVLDKSSITIEEFRAMSKVLHRLELFDNETMNFRLQKSGGFENIKLKNKL